MELVVQEFGDAGIGLFDGEYFAHSSVQQIMLLQIAIDVNCHSELWLRLQSL